MGTLNRDRWGHLTDRFAQDNPKKMLALDGGGIRGLMTARVLVELERLLAERVADDPSKFRLCDYFDYIGGTSTGAIIAAALARGMSASELLDFYQDFGKKPSQNETCFSVRNLSMATES